MRAALSIFFPYGISCEKLDALGILKREMRILQELSSCFEHIYIFSYGRDKDSVQKYASSPISIIPKPYGMPIILYSVLLPFIHHQYLRESSYLRTMQMTGSWTAVIAKLLYKKKLVIRIGYEYLKNFEKVHPFHFLKVCFYVMERIAYAHADVIIVTTEEIKNYIKKKFGLPDKKLVIIPNYVDTNLFRPMNIERKDKAVCCVGRLSNPKNTRTLIGAIARIGFELILIGNGPSKDELQQYARERGAKVLFKGVVANEDLPAELNQYAMFVLPSLYEGNPKALLEAMACGLACIGTDVDGIREVIRHRENGYLCAIDEESIAMAIQTLFHNKEDMIFFGLRAREDIMRLNSLDGVMDKERSLYKMC